MDKYCYEQEGTLCFSRPIYIDRTSVSPPMIPSAMNLTADTAN
jgi:hypothetical protein